MLVPKLTLYTIGSPNGHKVSIALELLNLPYKAYNVSLANNEQKEPWFLKISPNGKIPALVDHTNEDFSIFESGAILLYLAEHYDPNNKLLPTDPKLKSEAIQWLMWQMGGLGPMLGQNHHFQRFAPEKVPYGIKRYSDECHRLLSVLETRLTNRDYLVGDQLTVADIASFPWARGAPWGNIALTNYPNVNAWIERLSKVEEIEKGLNVPDKDMMKEMINDPKFVERAVKEVQSWTSKDSK